MKQWLVMAGVLIVAGLPDVAGAQRLDVGVGTGYVFGGGAENPGPSLPTVDVVGVVWPWNRWGLAVRWVEGPGEDLYAEPVTGGDRTFLGFGHLRYSTVTLRHRRRFSDSLGFELGAGLILGGRFASIQELPPIGRLDEPDNFFGGLASDAFLTRRLRGPLWVEAGVTFDFNIETNNLHPVVLVVYRF